MKKTIAKWLMRLAVWLDPMCTVRHQKHAKPMGLCVHITKKDVRDYRKDRPNIKSHREGMRALIEEAKWRVAGAIGRGLMEKGLVQFHTSSTLYTADVSGVAFVYDKEKADEE